MTSRAIRLRLPLLPAGGGVRDKYIPLALFSFWKSMANGSMGHNLKYLRHHRKGLFVSA